MKGTIKYRRLILVLLILTTTVFTMVRCISNDRQNRQMAEGNGETAGFEDYISAQTCITCHKEVTESYMHTAHYLTARPATEESIKGSFHEGENKYYYTPSIMLSMQKRDSGLYQVVYYKGEEKKAMPFDIVFGSGVMGQSYLTWRNNQLYQLPITYYTEAGQWSNSPGFPSDRVLIDRPVTSRCMECHTTYAKGIPENVMEPVAFDRSKIIYGIDCQKCHGPAAKHVTYHTENTQDKEAKYIVNPAKISRAKQLDACVLCHGGDIKKTKPSFGFTAGNDLSDYFEAGTPSQFMPQSAAIDVHGNQYALLSASKCFTMSTTLNCNSCHNTHKNERGSLATFSQRCITCHNTNDSKFQTPAHKAVVAVEKNCIDCHMPAQTSKSIAVFLEGEETPRASKLRSHFIAVYRDQMKEYLNRDQ